MDVNDVTEVDVGLPRVERFLPDSIEADHDLKRGAVALLQCRETQLSGVAGKHHPARDADDLAGLGVGGQVGIGLPDLGQGVRAGDVDRIRLAAFGEQPLTLGLTDPELLGKIGSVSSLCRGARLGLLR